MKKCQQMSCEIKLVIWWMVLVFSYIESVSGALENMTISNTSHVSSQPHLKFVSTDIDTLCPASCTCDQSREKIKKVDCADKGLHKIPLFPSSVRKIFLRNNSIQTVPCQSFKQVKSLTYLDISKNPLRSIFACSFENLGFLKHLIISGCSLTYLPEGIFHPLKNLQRLDLSENSLTHLIPLTFKEMIHLTHLDLHGNELKRLKNNTFYGLQSLKFLSLQGNRLLYGPNTFEVLSFRGLYSIKTLYLQRNQDSMCDDFVYPDQALSEVPSLHQLRMDGWPRILGPGFSQLKNLTYLHLGGGSTKADGICYMRDVMPENFFAALSTQKPLTLKMPRCGLSAIPPFLFKHIPTLRYLDLGENGDLGFDKFEHGSLGLQNSSLKMLNLTRITKPDGGFHSIKNTTFCHLKSTKLKVIYLDYNQLLAVSPQAVIDLPISIEYISLYNNRIQRADFIWTVFFHFRNLKIFKMSKQLRYTILKDLNQQTPISPVISVHNRKKAVQSAFWRGSEPVSDRKITLKKPKNLYFAAQTEKLREHNKFCGDSVHEKKNQGDQTYSSVLPFPLPPKLEVILASDIKASYDIPEIIFSNNNILKYIDYSKNDIRCFGGPIEGVPNLAYLDLSYNWCLKMNTRFFLHMTGLKTLLLHNNVLGHSLAEDTNGETFSTLCHLEILDLSNNAIQVLSENIFENNLALQVLNLSHNNLIHFVPSMSDTKLLERLDLSDNRLQGLSKSTCLQFKKIRMVSTDFQVIIHENDFRCSCDFLDFLKLLVEEPMIFEHFHNFQCRLTNGPSLGYDKLSTYLPTLEKNCLTRALFFVLLFCFILILGIVLIISVYHHKRWKLKYLTYVGKARLHIGSRQVTYAPAAKAFITYDQEDRACRSILRDEFLPKLQTAGISVILGETDFEGGPLANSIAGAVVSSRKTLVVLSEDIFKDFHRQLEINLAIMHELRLRRPVVVPVLLLPQFVHQHNQGLRAFNQSSNNGRGMNYRTRAQEMLAAHEYGCEIPLQSSRFLIDRNDVAMMLQQFPSEIQVFLKGQIHRCQNCLIRRRGLNAHGTLKR